MARAFRCFSRLKKSAPRAVRAAPAIEDAGGRILIIEDNAGIRQAYEIMLDDWGYETLSAASGEEALDLAAQEKVGISTPLSPTTGLAPA